MRCCVEGLELCSRHDSLDRLSRTSMIEVSFLRQKIIIHLNSFIVASKCVRPYHVENTGSRPITEVKQRRAWLVLRWVTAWEHHVLYTFLFHFNIFSTVFSAGSIGSMPLCWPKLSIFKLFHKKHLPSYHGFRTFEFAFEMCVRKLSL